MAGEYTEFLAATHDRYITGKSDETTKQIPELLMLQSKSQINFGCSGSAIVWLVKFDVRDLSQRSDLDAVTYTRKSVHKRASLNYKGFYEMNDAIGWQEEKQNKGKEAIIRLYDDKVKDMLADAKFRFQQQLYIDGAGEGNDEAMDGFETMCTQSGTLATDQYGVNDGTYASIDTTKGAYEVDSTEPAYDFWSPVLVNCVYNPGTGARTWAADCEKTLRDGIYAAIKGPSDMLDLIMLNRTSYQDLLAKLAARELFMNDNTKLKSLGFASGRQVALNFDGVDVSWSDAVPTEDGDGNPVRGYGWNFNAVSLEMLPSKLFETDTYYDQFSHAYQFSLLTSGNLKFKSPRKFVKFGEWSGAGS